MREIEEGEEFMNNMRRMIVALSVTCGTMASAWGADLPSRPAPIAVMPAPIFSWTGIYFGINGGGGWGDQQPLNLITNRFDGNSVGFSGGVFGGTAGAQIQMGHVVIGFEADLDWAGLSGSSTFVPTVGGIPINPAAISATTKIDWVGTARARVGYAEQNWRSTQREAWRSWAPIPVLLLQRASLAAPTQSTARDPASRSALPWEEVLSMESPQAPAPSLNIST